MSKGKKKYEQLDSDTVNIKLIKGCQGLYLYLNDVQVAGPIIQGGCLGDVMCSFNTKVIDLPRIK